MKTLFIALLLLPMSCAAENEPSPPTDRPTSAPTPAPTASVVATPTARPSAPAASAFHGSAEPLSSAFRRQMTGSTWEPGCPVSLDDLRYLRLTYWGADAKPKIGGELIVHRDQADNVLNIFRRLFDVRYPITKMRLMDVYDGDDDASMLDNNTSAFNCRKVKGSSNWSQHSYGRAIDVNPFRNPWVNGGTVDPPEAERYADRSIDDPQLIRHGDAVWDAFANAGWSWGGDWQNSKDYQHFSASGR